MTLSEIEITLDELTARHQNLNSELLSTLLLSAGWEDKNIKDAVMLFKQRKPKQPLVSVLVSKDQVAQEEVVVEPTEITFYQPDGSEEKKLQGFVETPPVHREEVKINSLSVAADTLLPPASQKEEGQDNQDVEERDEKIQKIVDESQNKEETSPRPDDDTKHLDTKGYVNENREPIVQEVEQLDLLTVPAVAENDTTQRATAPDAPKPFEQQSLISPEKVVPPSTLKQSVIPEDLPIVPFESSPHIWSFSRYKDTFHGEVMPEKNSSTHNDTVHVQTTSVSEIKVAPPVIEDVEIDLEKTPMTKGDESLVFLAGIMLLVIILILGYMYSNGRL